MAIRRFEELYAWQSARRLVVRVFEITKWHPMAGNRSFCDQIQRAVVSTMSNIAEGFERGTQAEFKRYLGIAKGSNGEVRSLLHVAGDLGYMSDSVKSELIGFTEETGRLIAGLQRSIELRGKTVREDEEFYLVNVPEQSD
jgi:four helix bundle protein